MVGHELSPFGSGGGTTPQLLRLKTDRAINRVKESAGRVLRAGPLSDSSLIAWSISILLLINVVSPSYVARRSTAANKA